MLDQEQCLDIAGEILLREYDREILLKIRNRFCYDMMIQEGKFIVRFGIFPEVLKEDEENFPDYFLIVSVNMKDGTAEILRKNYIDE